MSENKKDFLSQFSSDGKPDSYKEEVRTPIEKPSKKLPKKAIAIVSIILVILLIASYFLFFAPKIEMPNFVGKSESDIATWARQYGIETKGIVVNKEYNFDNDAGIVLEQSIIDGKKIKKDAKITFVVSNGADPEEKIHLPDIATMKKSEIESWIKTNKLSKTKIMNTYSDTVAEGEVISFDLKVDKEDFKRSTALTISISKGPQPAQSVKIEDFKGKVKSEVETWAKTNKVQVNFVETFSNTVDVDKVISQSPEAGKTLADKQVLTIYISKGEGVKVPNLLTMSKSGVEDFVKKYGISIKEKYADASTYVLSQSLKANSTVSLKDLADMTITVNKGNGFYLDTEGLGSINGSSYDLIRDKVDALKEVGIYISLKKTEIESDKQKGEILSHSIYTSGNEYSDIQKLPLNVTIHVTVSKGGIAPTPTPETITMIDLTTKSLADAETWAKNNSINLNKVYGKFDNNKNKDTIIGQSEQSGSEVVKGSTVTITLSRGHEYYLEDILKETGFEILNNSTNRVEDWANSQTIKDLGLEITIDGSAVTSDPCKITGYKIKGSDNGESYSVGNKIKTTKIQIILEG